MDCYYQQRTTSSATYYKRSPPTALWSILPSEASTEWKAAATFSSWLALALRTINTTALAGYKWTSRRLRKGAASAASCIGAPLPVIKYMGGLAKNSSVTEGKYIDPTMAPSRDGWRFFGWLAPSAPQHEYWVVQGFRLHAKRALG
jgi:hypothetical protein